MTSTHIRSTSNGSRGDRQPLAPSSVYGKPVGTHRLDGPALPPNGTPTRTSSLERLNERLEHLAFGRRPEGHDAPPLETYTTSPTEHGDVVRATEEYVRWFRRTYPASGSEDRVSKPAPGPSAEGVGGEAPGRLDRFKAKSP